MRHTRRNCWRRKFSLSKGYLVAKLARKLNTITGNLWRMIATFYSLKDNMWVLRVKYHCITVTADTCLYCFTLEPDHRASWHFVLCFHFRVIDKQLAAKKTSISMVTDHIQFTLHDLRLSMAMVEERLMTSWRQSVKTPLSIPRPFFVTSWRCCTYHAMSHIHWPIEFDANTCTRCQAREKKTGKPVLSAAKDATGAKRGKTCN